MGRARRRNGGWERGGFAETDAGLVRGEKTVHGDPERLSKELGRALLQTGAGVFASLFEVPLLFILLPALGRRQSRRFVSNLLTRLEYVA